ncbi:MAG: hypothetical protein ACI96M_003524, partial [Candidatus Azotimanducaceae bacterium]
KSAGTGMPSGRLASVIFLFWGINGPLLIE